METWNTFFIWHALHKEAWVDGFSWSGSWKQFRLRRSPPENNRDKLNFLGNRLQQQSEGGEEQSPRTSPSSNSSPLKYLTSFSFRRRTRAGSKRFFFQFVRENFKSNFPPPSSKKEGSLLSTPLWCSEPATATPARCCRCCSSPWRRCSHCCRGGRCSRPRRRWCQQEAWAWWWRRPAAGASSCWFYAPWLGGSGTRSSPGAEKKKLLLFTLEKELNLSMLLLVR